VRLLTQVNNSNSFCANQLNVTECITFLPYFFVWKSVNWHLFTSHTSQNNMVLCFQITSIHTMTTTFQVRFCFKHILMITQLIMLFTLEQFKPHLSKKFSWCFMLC